MPPARLFEESASELFEETPCGYLTTDLEGVIARVNRTFEQWTGYTREELVGRVRFADLLNAGGRIYHETHYAPLLFMQGSVREIALEIRCSDGSALPVLVNSVLRRDEAGEPGAIRTTIFDATDRRRYEQELLAARRRDHDIALQLQRSMLLGRLPTGSGFDVEAYYAPAEGTLEVGGDWYDSFWLDDATLGLVIGDVVGRGIGAAVVMGQLRSAVRALAARGLGPAALLQAMDGYCESFGLGQTTTMIYALLEPKRRALRFACAGHPPPALLAAGGEAELLWGGRSWPLALPGGGERREGACELAPGATLILYTDGLIERREPDSDGLELLVDQLPQFSGDRLSDLLANLAQAVAEPGMADDVCLLGVRTSD